MRSTPWGWLAGWRESLVAARERRLVYVAGDVAECQVRFDEIAAVLDGTGQLWVGAAAAADRDVIDPTDASRRLGEEFDLVFYDLRAGMDPDAIGALAGTLRAGGLLVLAGPPLDEWSGFCDPVQARVTVWPVAAAEVTRRYLVRFARMLATDPTVVVIGTASKPAPTHPEAASAAQVDPPYRSRDQADAVAAIEHVVHGQRRRPVVLQADRGRGKSAALGLAAGRLLAGGLRRVVVTSAVRAAAGAVFEHAASVWTAARQVTNDRLADARGALEFLPVDRLLADDRPVDLVLVDEAATLPTPLLARLLERFGRIAFATTVHGYEGSGRGFALRFQTWLDTHTRGWRRVTLNEPIRYAATDPLERWTFRALLLNASAAPDESFAGVDVAQARIERLDRDRLAGDEAQLAEVFGLLVSAHYRTRPLDLRHLLDGPNLEVWIARLNGSVAAVALVAREGGFDAQLAERIGAGLTRPHGHLLPETLASHMGLVTAAGLSAIRVLRIAVHPAVQRQGLGSQMLDQLVAQGAARGFAYAGGSFGADPGLVHFWRRAGFEPVRISARANAASGAHSVLMLCGMSVDGAGVVHRARRAFARDWPVAFGDGLNGLDPDLALELCRGADPGIGLDADERSALAAFAHGRRIVEAVAGPLWRFAASELAAASLSSTAARLLLVRVIQRGDWTACARRLGLSGRAELVERLRAAVRERVAAPGDTTGAGA